MTRAELEAEVERAWTTTGEPAAAIGTRLGVSKNTVLGLCHRRGWIRPDELMPKYGPRGVEAPIETMEDRFRRLEAQMDMVLAETVGIGRITNAESAERKAAWQARNPGRAA